MGATGLLTLDMLEREGVLAAGGFVGVDLDAARIDGFRQSRPDLKWIAGNLYEHLHAPEMANVGILNLDEYGGSGTQLSFSGGKYSQSPCWCSQSGSAFLAIKVSTERPSIS